MKRKSQYLHIIGCCLAIVSVICTFLPIFKINSIVSFSMSFADFLHPNGLLALGLGISGADKEIRIIKNIIVIHILLNFVVGTCILLKRKIAYVVSMIIGMIQFLWWGFVTSFFVLQADVGNALLDDFASADVGLGLWGYTLAALGVSIVSVLLLRLPREYHNDTGTKELTESKGVIVGISGQYAGAKIEVDNISVVLGRDSNNCQLILNGPKISRKHCSISFDSVKKVYTVIDFSSNGTFLDDGTRLKSGEINELKPGSMICIDDMNTFMLE